MPKQKTHSGTKDRMRRHTAVNHNLQKKSASAKRTFAGNESVLGKSITNMKRKLGVK
jgi:ribosomal protein L35